MDKKIVQQNTTDKLNEREKRRLEIRKEIQFWAKQPVIQMMEMYRGGSKIHTEIDIDNVRKEPYALPNGFEWGIIDMENNDDMNMLYDFLEKYYVEGGDFRLNYSRNMLRWALCVPHHDKNMFVSVKTSNGKMVGFISGIPVRMQVYDKQVDMTEINFLCVHKKLRSKRLAPVLIKEITRRSYLKNTTSAIYTAGKPITKPLSRTKYYHRLLNPKKLVDVGFSDLPPGKKISDMVNMYKMGGDVTMNLMRMTESDVEGVHKLLSEHLKTLKLHPILSVDEVRHSLLPREELKDVIDTFVAKDNDGNITDMCSYYMLPSKITKQDVKGGHTKLNIAYSYYNVATSKSVTELVRNLLLKIKDEEFDVFNMLNVMDNCEAIDKLRFLRGNGYLYYYMYNWRCEFINSTDNGLVLC